MKITFRKFMTFLTVFHCLWAFSAFWWAITTSVPGLTAPADLLAYFWIAYGTLIDKTGLNTSMAVCFFACFAVFAVRKLQKPNEGLIFAVIITLLNTVCPYIGYTLFWGLMSV
ncbi:MAG: hypothetical protein IJL89_06255 [Firmicutes bacterium]|nr:hypothetical protein [Bacillota bacterium]